DHAGGGVVDQDIQRAELLLHLIEHPGQLLGLTDMPPQGYGPNPELARVGGGLFRGLLIAQVIDDHVGTTPRELERGGAADPAAATGYQGNAPAQLVHSPPSADRPTARL